MVRQVSVTRHRNSPQTVFVDGVVTVADTHAEVGKVLQDAGIKPDQRVNVMDERGRQDRVLAGHYLPSVPVKKPKRGRK